MPKFNVLSGTWYHIEAPDQATAEKVYDAYWGSEDMPEGCTVEEGEVDSHWDDYVYVPKEETPEPPKGWTLAW